ncbi:MAG: four helix bundle protein [Candidatus Marinimicrobia bacterium]|nr:four helix bundle protein [Candidatus Neomarinimicrobiota bacterium]
MGYKDFTEMPVWQQSFELLVRIYKTMKNYPSDERFGLISDMRRSAPKELLWSKFHSSSRHQCRD